MPINANATFRKLLVASLPGPTGEKRRSLVENIHPRPKCILNAGPSLSPNASNLSEAEAIQRAKAGDPAVFEYLYRLHSPRVYALCLRMIRDTTEAEDLTQEAFLLLFRKIHTFRGESAFSTWLHRLAVNLVLMRLRKKAPSVVSIEAPADSDDENAPSRNLEYGVPDLTPEGSIDRINLERCIALLPAGFRKVFVLHDIQGYEHHEIAEILGRSVGDSKSQLHKARKRLRELLREVQRDKARNKRLAAANGVSTESAFAGQAQVQHVIKGTRECLLALRGLGEGERA
jgi:RNA polymerase sigma-70 factor (ECF subfamily)